MEGAPPKLVAELAGLLRAISVTMPTHLGESSGQAHHKDTLHKQNTRIQALLHEIRGMPGLERFMLGSTYTTLCKAAHRHPVVVLVAGRGHALAFVISSADEDQPRILHLDLTLDELSGLRGAAEKSGFRSRALIHEYDLETRQDMRKMLPGRMGLSSSHCNVLETLWRKIVEPVIAHLQLQVRMSNGMRITELTNRVEEYRPVASLSSLVR
jgi:hypothetical protein